MLKVRNLQTLPELLALQATWQQLVNADSSASMCSTWEWTAAWIEQFWLAEFEPRVLLVEESPMQESPTEQTSIEESQIEAIPQTAKSQVSLPSRPLALLPLYLNTRTQEIFIIGTGEPEACEVASEYLDLLLDETCFDPARAIAALIPALQKLHCKKIIWYNCLEASRLAQLVKGYKHSVALITGRQYGVDLQKPFELITKQFSYNNRKKGQLLLNRFDKNADLTCEILVDDSSGIYLATLKALHQADWSARDKPGAFADQRFEHFHKTLALAYRKTQQEPASDLYGLIPSYAILRHQQEIVAVHYYLRWRERLYFYQSGTVKDRLQTYSPGRLLHMLLFRELAGSDCYYDFMKGAVEGGYKAGMCELGPLFYTFTIYPQTFRGWIHWQLERAKQVLKVWLVKRRKNNQDS